MPSEAPARRTTISGPTPKPDLEVEVIAVSPIFLVGEHNARRQLADLLDGRDGIACSPESDLLADLAAATRRNWARLVRYGYPEQYWLWRTAGFFDALQMEYARSRRLTRWAATIDPGGLGLADRLFPRCRVVRLVRRDTRRLSARYYQLSNAELTSRPEFAVNGVLSFLDPLIEAEAPARP